MRDQFRGANVPFHASLTGAQGTSSVTEFQAGAFHCKFIVNYDLLFHVNIQKETFHLVVKKNH